MAITQSAEQIWLATLSRGGSDLGAPPGSLAAQPAIRHRADGSVTILEERSGTDSRFGADLDAAIDPPGRLGVAMAVMGIALSRARADPALYLRWLFAPITLNIGAMERAHAEWREEGEPPLFQLMTVAPVVGSDPPGLVRTRGLAILAGYELEASGADDTARLAAARRITWLARTTLKRGTLKTGSYAGPDGEGPMRIDLRHDPDAGPVMRLSAA